MFRRSRFCTTWGENRKEAGCLFPEPREKIRSREQGELFPAGRGEVYMLRKRARIMLVGILAAGLPTAAAVTALGAVGSGGGGEGPRDAVLRDRNGTPIQELLDPADTITAANGSVYMAGPPYSPKQTCGRCHNYDAVTRAFHFREGTGPRGENLSDHWSDEHKDGTLYKYLANAYAYIISPGEYGAW